MAIGDRIPTELTVPTPLSVTATAVFTNCGASYRTQATQIFLCNTGASKRVVTLFKNRLVSANQIANSITLPSNTSTIIDTKWVLTGINFISS